MSEPSSSMFFGSYPHPPRHLGLPPGKFVVVEVPADRLKCGRLGKPNGKTARTRERGKLTIDGLLRVRRAARRARRVVVVMAKAKRRAARLDGKKRATSTPVKKAA